MSDLYIDDAMLTRVRANLQRVQDLLGTPLSAMRAVDGSALGAPALERRMDEFSEEWEYGVSRLGEFAGSASEALTAVQQAFDRADQSLAAALEGAR